MRKTMNRADAEAIRDEINAAKGYPRKLEEHEIVRIGGGPHIEIWNTSAVAVEGDGVEVTVMIDDGDEKHIEPARRARLRAAKEPVEDSRSPEDRNPKIKR